MDADPLLCRMRHTNFILDTVMPSRIRTFDVFRRHRARIPRGPVSQSRLRKSKNILKQAVICLVSAISFILRERTLNFAKPLLSLLPYGKATAIASLLIEKFPTSARTMAAYASGRPRWRRSFVFCLNPHCPLSKLFALTGLYQPEMTTRLLNSKQRGMFVDVGANFGYFSVLWLSKPNTTVLAIEPILQNYELLTANLCRFGTNVRTVRCCLGEQVGEVTMSYDPEYPMLSRICPDATHGQRVKMLTLCNVLEKNNNGMIEILKCDAEGHDVRILSSARELFENKRVRTVFFEPETSKGERDSELEEFLRFLAANGYRLISSQGDLCYSLITV
jgi:FkbM family methyltransferase